MKNVKIFIKNNICGFIIGSFIFGSIGVYATSEMLSTNITYDNSTSGLSATNAQDAIDEIYKKYKLLNSGTGFDYTGSEQTYTVTEAGTYKLEVWGAQGGSYSDSYIGGYGAYAVGTVSLKAGDVLYINVGGQGSLGKVTSSSTSLEINGGFNGGGNLKLSFSSTLYSGAGGGATHIATSSGLLSTLSNNLDSILIVAGGGGGSAYYKTDYCGSGGNGGGIQGNDGTACSSAKSFATGGSQTAGGYMNSNSEMGIGSFGKGADSCSSGTTYYGGVGGGGLYGGGASCSKSTNGGGGGSSYIGNSLLSDKKMYCYNCTTSTDEATLTVSNTCVNSTAAADCSKTGNGYAKITLISTTE